MTRCCHLFSAAQLFNLCSGGEAGVWTINKVVLLNDMAAPSKLAALEHDRNAVWSCIGAHRVRKSSQTAVRKPGSVFSLYKILSMRPFYPTKAYLAVASPRRMM